jgi:hypothetical protein
MSIQRMVEGPRPGARMPPKPAVNFTLASATPNMTHFACHAPRGTRQHIPRFAVS